MLPVQKSESVSEGKCPAKGGNKLARPTVGLALGAGAARGLSHIGVLKVFEEEGIPVDYIAGTSIGALIGAIYSAGQSIHDMEKIAMHLKKAYFIDFTLPKMGFIEGNRIRDFVRLFTYNKNIEELKIPLAIVATDIRTGERIVFTEGNAADAVRASVAIPGVIVPVKWKGRLLVDGAVSDRLPVSIVREMGADIVIAVDVTGLNTNAELNHIVDIIMQSMDMMQMEIVQNREDHSDIMIRPDVVHFGSFSFERGRELIQAGEQAARAQIERIKHLLTNWKESD